MTALAELPKATRRRTERLGEWRNLDRLMRQPGLLSAPREDQGNDTKGRSRDRPRH